MSGRVQAGRSGTSARWPRPSLAIGAAFLAFCASSAAAPYLFKGATLRSEIAEQVRATMGLTLTVDGPVQFTLFPQPHIEMADLHLVDRSGTLRIDAASLRGEVRILPLLVGRLEIASAALERPRLAIDLDAGGTPADSAIGRALRPSTVGAAPIGAAPGSQRLGAVTLLDGIAVLKSKGQARDLHVDAVNVTIDWRNLDAPATLTGTVAFEGVDADVAAWVAQPSNLLRGDSSAITLRIRSAPLDLSASGDFAGAPAARYHGRVTVRAPSLGEALALVGVKATLPAPFANFTLTSDATVGGGTLDLPNLRLRCDENSFEGTLAYQGGGPAPTLSGTLATEQFSLTPFTAKAPPLLDRERRWSQEKLHPDLRDDLRLDLRVSATHLRLPPYVVDDAALAVMTRNGRTEIALVEGKAYGGALKGHASVGISDAGFSVRVAGALTGADASALSWELFGRQLAVGALTASANLEGLGDSPDALVRSLRGWVKGRASDGELSGINLGAILRDPAGARGDGLLGVFRKGRTPFQTADFALQVADGIVTVEAGRLQGPDARLTLEGKADLPQRTLDLQSTASEPPATGTKKLEFLVTGPFDQAIVAPDPTGSSAPRP